MSEIGRLSGEGFIMADDFSTSSCRGKHAAVVGQALFLLYAVWASDSGVIPPVCKVHLFFAVLETHTKMCPEV